MNITTPAAEPFLPLIQDGFPLVVGGLLTVAVLMLFGSYSILRHRSWKSRSVRATGEVVRLETDRPGEAVESTATANDGTMKETKIRPPRRVWPVFRYQDSTGTEHERRSPSSFSGTAISVGDEVELFLPADRPYAARTDSGSEVRVAIGAMIAAASVLAAIILSLIF